MKGLFQHMHSFLSGSKIAASWNCSVEIHNFF